MRRKWSFNDVAERCSDLSIYSEQMYKKRLKEWGFSKQVKAKDKERALTRIIHNEPVTSEEASIPHDKLVRYAKSRAKSGALGDHHLRKITRQYKTGDDPHLAVIGNVPRSPTLPDQFAKFDVFLQAMQALIVKERIEWLTRRQDAPDAIFSALTKGMSLWRKNAFTAGRKAFSQAALRTVEDLRSPEISVSRITYCISSILWGSSREQVFLKFAESWQRLLLKSWDQHAL